ncbi:MAG TPA: chromate transporter [Gammaproteobacteria bacterium]|nr:chromate transporter [Gammaproteobacteria bacterium]
MCYAIGINPLLAGIVGSIITTWVTFVPSFLWIFSGAPYIERLRKLQSLNAAFTAITAAVVGVILNLSLWLTLNTLFKTVGTLHYGILRLYVPSWHTFDVGTFIIMLYAVVIVFFYKKGLFFVLSSCVLLGFAIKLFFPISL